MNRDHPALSCCIVGLLLGAPSVSSAVDPRERVYEVAGCQIPRGEKRKFTLEQDRSFEGTYLDMPLWIAHGARSGVTLCVCAGVHGDEINGVEIARRVFAGVDARALAGTLLTLPAINADGFRSGVRYLPDRRDLNRAFPGNPDGSLAALIADAVFRGVVARCDALIDLHTASNRRANLPQVRVDLDDDASRDLAVHFGVGSILHGAGPPRSLRREAVDAGVPAMIYEAGEPLRFQEEEIERGVAGVRNVMAYLDMVDRPEREIPESKIYRRSSWLRAARGQAGFFFPAKQLGEPVAAGEVLGVIVDPMTDARHPVVASWDGDLVGMAVPQPVLSGNALFHIARH